jgi:chondroitin 4-sulfotransferase 11
MVYSELYKIAVITPPKSGSHTILRTIFHSKILAHQHATYTMVKKKFPLEYENIIKDFKKYFVVRNPWAHAVSLYIHKTEKRKLSIEIVPDNEKQWYKTFESYLKKDLYVPQSTFTFKDPLFVYDEVIKFERLNDDLESLCENFDIPYLQHNENLGINHENYFGYEYPENYQDFYTDELIDIVAKVSQNEINKFGYTF